MGLKKSFQIGKIVIHPKDPNIVYVGALGRLYGPNEERGLFKTTDGGKTWKKVLFVDDKTGVIDMRMDPFDPDTLLVAMWERQARRVRRLLTARPTSGPTSRPVRARRSPTAPAAGCSRPPTAARPGRSSPTRRPRTACRRVKTGRIGLDYSRKTKGLVYAIIDTENIGKGRPPLTVYMGLSSDTAKGGGVKVTDDPDTDDGPAGKAGLKKDDVIVMRSMARRLVDYEAMLDFMSKKKPDDVVKFTVKRDGKELTLDVKLGRRPTGGGGAGAGGGGGGRQGGRPVVVVLGREGKAGRW